MKPLFLLTFFGIISIFFASCEKKSSTYVYPDRRRPELVVPTTEVALGPVGGQNTTQISGSTSFQVRGAQLGGPIAPQIGTSISFRVNYGGLHGL